MGPAARSETATPVPLQPVPDDNFDFNGAFVPRGSVGLHPQQRCLDPAGCQAGRHDAVGNASQGNSVTLSADGNTAIVGGPGNNSDAGAVWGRRRVPSSLSDLADH